MRIYELRWYARDADNPEEDDGCGCAVEWHGSQDSARRRLRELMNADRVSDNGPCSILPVSIITTKSGILKFLNDHFKTDNG